jgi:hypothetical protein
MIGLPVHGDVRYSVLARIVFAEIQWRSQTWELGEYPPAPANHV